MAVARALWFLWLVGGRGRGGQGEAEGGSIHYVTLLVSRRDRRHDTARSWVDDKSHQEAGRATRGARAFVLTHLCVVVTSKKYRVHGTRVSTVVCRALYFTEGGFQLQVDHKAKI